MSKGNDINVGSIEEDIKILKNYLKNSAYKEIDSDFFKNGGWEIVDLTIPQSIEHLLQDYTRHKQINEEHQKENGLLREKIKELKEENAMLRKSNNIAKDVKIEDITQLINKSYKEFMNGFIPKQKIKNKKEEFSDKAKRIAGTYQYADSEDDLIEKKNKVIKLRTKAETCEELLQESEVNK